MAACETRRGSPGKACIVIDDAYINVTLWTEG